jgi:L-aminopeptidase/D-esterase-like protein
MGEATTIAIVATDAPLTQAEALRMATAAQDGMARAHRAVAIHRFDGDLVFAARHSAREVPDAIR